LGGWNVPAFDEVVQEGMRKLMGRKFDLLLGRKSYDLLRAHWTLAASRGDETGRLFNRICKFVATRSPDADLGWENTINLGSDVLAELRRIKRGHGPDLITQGSADLLKSLFASDLVDEIMLFTFPVILGSGKRLFNDGSAPSGMTLVSSTPSPSGVVINHYARAGVVLRGSFALA
jgi:dihydrofolate reductase